MGFSTVSAQLLFFLAVVGISAGVIAVFGGFVDQAKGAMVDKQHFITGQLRTDIIITNIDNSSGDLNIYAKNVGKQQLDTDCLELYVDSGWVALTAPKITNPSTGAAVDKWDSEATIKIDPSSAPLNSGTLHEAKVITCNGISDTENF